MTDKTSADLLAALQVLETTSRRFAEGLDRDPSYVLRMCTQARSVITSLKEQEQ